MPLIVGKYEHYKNEDLDYYFVAAGLPYMARKMVAMITPVMEISLDGDTMRMKTTSLIWNADNIFKLGEEYIEDMPKDSIKSVTRIINDQEVLTQSVIQSTGCKTERHYLFTEEEVIETLTHENAKGVTKRYYKRVK